MPMRYNAIDHRPKTASSLLAVLRNSSVHLRRLHHIFGVLFCLTLVVSAVIRPPGTMLVMQGDTLTYTLCTGADTQTISVNLDETDDREIDLSCDFFAAQIAALPLTAPAVNAQVMAYADAPLVTRGSPSITAFAWPPYASRAPPVVI